MMTFHSRLRVVVLLLGITTIPVMAGEAEVVDANAIRSADGTYQFDVTVSHADSGWDHYADAFEILAPDGTLLGTRTLLHPHGNEQPFTRSLTGVSVQQGISEVRVRAHDNVHGYGSKEYVVVLPEN